MKYNINLLKSTFKMKGGLNLLQFKIINFWKNLKIYKNYYLNKKFFIIHDGPPFANGEIHLGHILNKILKDIILKFKVICGYKTNFILGWDCFGLPIENKFKYIKNYKNELLKKNIISKYVYKIVNNQLNDFRNLGIIFNHNYTYKTMNYKNISEEIRLLYNYNKKKYIYRKYKFLFWCFKCNSYLSKSYINYIKKTDLTLIVYFLFLKIYFLFKNFKLKRKYILGGILIWTTLPWALISNQSLAVDYEYLYSYISTIKGNFILNIQKYIKFKKYINKKIYLKKIFKGINLKDSEYVNPLYKINTFLYKKSKIIIIKNKLKNIGSGIINISPNYGLEDYKIYKRNYNLNFKLINIFLKNGLFMKKFFHKKNIISLNYLIIKYLFKNNKVFIVKNYNHKYMYCLEHKIPVFYKLINQWFLSFKNKFVKYINKIFFFPKKAKLKFKNLLKNKPKWNISRQRSWGIYISNIISKINKNHYFYKFISNYSEFYGIKFWYNFNKLDIYNLNSIFYKKLYETLDTWFDSGTTHWHVLRQTHKYLLKFPSDLYLEGDDQHRGWFQSSLITSLLLNNKLPFKNLISHGFIKTIYGDKLSKSLNNYINYKNLLNYISIDIIRLLFCNTKYTKNIILTKNLLNNTVDVYRKIRNFIKFIISNISDLNLNNIFINSFYKINKHLLNYFYLFMKKNLILYNKYKFNTLLKEIKLFISEDLSGIYFNIIKNNLYINILNSKNRKLTQITLFYILINFLKLLFPILPFTVEESYFKLFYKNYILNSKFIIIKKKISYEWLKIKYIKYIFYKNIEYFRKSFKFLNLNIKLNIFLNKNLYKFFIKNKNKFINLFSIYKFKINIIKKSQFFMIYKIYKNKKCLRCWLNKKLIKKNICLNCYIKLYKQNLLI